MRIVPAYSLGVMVIKFGYKEIELDLEESYWTQYISVWIRKNIATEFDLSLIILIQLCPRASFPQGLS